jgi:hypothetical protein
MMMKKTVIVALTTYLAILVCGCGGLAANNSPGFTGPNVSGTWEIAETSTAVPGNTLLVETNFTQNGSKVSATGASILLLGFTNGASEDTAMYLGGLCSGSGVDSLAATIGNDGSIGYSLNEGGNLFSGTGNTTSSTMSGLYQETSGTCADSGTLTGILVPSFDQLSFAACNMSSAPYIESTSVSEQENHSVVVSGTYNGGIPYTLDGDRLGKVMNLAGDIDGQTTHVYAYLYNGDNLYIYDESGNWLGLCSNPK